MSYGRKEDIVEFALACLILGAVGIVTQLTLRVAVYMPRREPFPWMEWGVYMGIWAVIEAAVRLSA